MTAARRTTAAPDAEELRRFYTLTPENLALVTTARGEGHCLALALTLVWACAERALIADPTALPAPVIAFVAAHLREH